MAHLQSSRKSTPANGLRTAQNYSNSEARLIWGRGAGDSAQPNMQKTTMNKTWLVLAATTSITVFLLAASPAEARCQGCAAGAGVVAGAVTGAIVDTAIPNTFFYISIGTILAMRRRPQSS
jgi:hypothetical protein